MIRTGKIMLYNSDTGRRVRTVQMGTQLAEDLALHLAAVFVW